MNNMQKQFFQEIKRLLPCDAKQKKRCVRELENDVASFIECNPDATMTDLYEAIGHPQAIAESFLERMNPEQLARKLSAKRKIAIGVISTMAILAIVLGILAITFADDIHNFHQGYYVDSLVELPSGVEPPPSPVTVN
jgi:hypothetical protein